jgi:opacity protein-like surface antigen
MRTPGARSSTWILMVSVIANTAIAASAAGQTSRKWEIEVHGGAVLPANQSGGTAALPGPGVPFTTQSIYGPPAPPVLVVSQSRRISSWYFGDGALLFDQAATAVAANPAAMTAPFPGRIVALDPVLLGSLGEIDRGGAIGARVTRALTARFGVEVGIDYGLARVRVAPATRDSIEATRTSFIPAFTGVIASNPSRAVRSITSNASLDEGSARELFASGALIVNLKTTGRMTPYATIGAALVATDGDLPRATLTGNYQFANVTTGASYNETDRVAVSDTRDTRSLAGILGGGMKYDVSARWGVRFDVRVFLGSNPADTRLDADPDVVLGPLPAGRVTLNAEPTIQFGNSADPVTALGVTGLAPSSLSGPAITGFRTWSGHGVSTHTSVTGGVFWRF